MGVNQETSRQHTNTQTRLACQLGMTAYCGTLMHMVQTDRTAPGCSRLGSLAFAMTLQNYKKETRPPTTGSVLGYSLCFLSLVQHRFAPASMGTVGAPQRPQNPFACRRLRQYRVAQETLANTFCRNISSNSPPDASQPAQLHDLQLPDLYR